MSGRHNSDVHRFAVASAHLISTAKSSLPLGMLASRGKRWSNSIANPASVSNKQMSNCLKLKPALRKIHKAKPHERMANRLKDRSKNKSFLV